MPLSDLEVAEHSLPNSCKLPEHMHPDQVLQFLEDLEWPKVGLRGWEGKEGESGGHQGLRPNLLLVSNAV